MRGGTILALLLVALPLIAVSSDGRPPGTGESAAHGRSLPSVQNQSLEISFEKSEYLEMNLSGNITMNITFTSKKNVDVNVTVSSYFRNSQGDSLAATTSSSLDGIKYIVLAPLEARTLSVNVSVKPFLKDGYFGRMAYIVRASNSNMTSRNYTMIVSWGQYSVKVVEPAPSMGECHVAVGTPITIRLNVTNYSDGILDGILEQDGGRRTVLVGPKSSVMVNITISPFLEATKTMLEFPLSTPNSFSGIGFDMENGHATNVTDPYVTVNAHEPLRILVHKGNLNLSEPGSINISIVSGTNHLQKNLLFSV